MTKKRILLWGAAPEVPKCESFEHSYQCSGENLGNILIGNGIVAVLKDCKYVTRDKLSGPNEANDVCDHIVIPAANFLWKGFDFGYMYDFIKQTDLPITIVGLGAQTNDRSLISEIHPNTLRLVKHIAERSPSLGVRGFYTAEVLAANGILNVEILGCPSLYTKCSPPKEIISSSTTTIENLAVNFSRRVASHSFNPEALKKVENILLNFAITNNLIFIAQDELEELSVKSAKATSAECTRITDYFDEISPNKVISYFKEQTHYFCNVSDWSAFLMTRSGSIGSRLHGNLLALVNGRPALTIAHDSRTLEMCALTGAPYIHVNGFPHGEITETSLIEAFQTSDYGLFVSNMHTLFEKYKIFLNKHELSNNLV